ncbi:MAG: transketolase [Rickettsiaceae bacterium]|nr:transketolase [Rickettsiaceae bacterium]
MYSQKDLSNAIRILAADAIEVAKSGHPGMPLGMADVMTCLAAEFLTYNPNDPKWFNRDRLVLSAGHGSMLLYAFYYLAGYKDFTLEDIKNFRQISSKAAGHPEYGIYQAIETTTGPLGQGLATSVGMAIAAKKYQAKLGKEICNYNIYSIVGDGCLMEGISYEAASIAGHLQLDNLIVIFDDNNISIDGSTSLSVSEDHLAKFKAFGFEVYSVGGHDSQEIQQAISKAKSSNKPSFIACKTVIGKGAGEKAGSAKSHGAPLGDDEIKYLRDNINFSKEPFDIPKEIKTIWENLWERNKDKYQKWQENFNKLTQEEQNYLAPAKLQLPKSLQKLAKDDQNKQEATRKSSGKIIAALMESNDKVICGSADLAGSNNLMSDNCKQVRAQDFSGNFIYYGVREHAMAAIMNGLALSGFIPIGGTFLVFSDYMRPAIRLSAMMNLPVIYIMTHDSIGVGEDGPTHQPVEHLASLRAMPNLTLYRPTDFIETLETYQNIAANNQNPAMLALTRQAVLQVRKQYDGNNNLVAKGGYIVSDVIDETKQLDLVIFASGSEVQLALEVKEILLKENYQIRVISVPSFELLEKQGKEYIAELCGAATNLKIAIEAGTSFGWHKIIGDNGLFFGVEEFGVSAPGKDVYQHFKLDAKLIAESLMSTRILQL